MMASVNIERSEGMKNGHGSRAVAGMSGKGCYPCWYATREMPT